MMSFLFFRLSEWNSKLLRQKWHTKRLTLECTLSLLHYSWYSVSLRFYEAWYCQEKKHLRIFVIFIAIRATWTFLKQMRRKFDRKKKFQKKMKEYQGMSARTFWPMILQGQSSSTQRSKRFLPNCRCLSPHEFCWCRNRIHCGTNKPQKMFSVSHNAKTSGEMTWKEEL